MSALMSKTPKTAAGATPVPADLPFEAALKRLEAIVTAMEADDLPLETLLARYEEGARLVEVCQARLAAAEVRLQQLERTATGDTVLKPVAVETPGTSGGE
jgi:exodeoxyribonuclease VII small subunit